MSDINVHLHLCIVTTDTELQMASILAPNRGCGVGVPVVDYG